MREMHTFYQSVNYSSRRTPTHTMMLSLTLILTVTLIEKINPKL